MSSGAEPLQMELARIVTGYPDLDAILDKMYEDVNDPYYTGNPAETLRQVIETWEEYEALRGMPDYPDLFPEDIKFDVPGFDAPETFDTNALGLIFDETPQDTIKPSPASYAFEEDPNFSKIFRLAENSITKLDSGVGADAEEPQKPIRWVRRKLESARKKVDPKPKRLGPEGTWVNESNDKPGDQTGTLVQWERTETSLRREDTLTD